jgi:glucose dehydrogenase
VIPPFHRQQTTSADLNQYFLTDDERAEWKARIDELEALGRTGLFVPPSDEYATLATPGAVGGANWGNTAADPDKGRVYVYARIWPSLYEPLELRTPEPSAAASGGRSFGGFGPAYPEGADTPDYRYFSPGYGLEHAAVFRPPWSTLTAYDLNEGTILWQRPIGTDLMAAQEGGENTGVPEAQRNGMIVTSSGVLFSTAKDGRVYALDADTGDELWSAELPRATEGPPAMYEIDGRSYLVVTATSTLTWGTGDKDDEFAALRPESQGGYVVFALVQ